MERPMHQNLHILRQFTDSQSLKMVTQLFLSFSVFSLFFSHSSFLSFLHSINFCFSTFPYQLFTHTIDKNCIFLLCNGLLVFLAKFSGLSTSFSLSSHQDDQSHSKNTVEGSQLEQLMPQKKELILGPEGIGLVENVGTKEGNYEEEYCFTNQREEEKEVVEVKEQEKEGESMTSNEEQEEEEEEEQQQQDREEEEEETALVQVAKDEEERNWLKDDFLIEQNEEEDEEEEGNGVLSTEELNKKFDEFIRRMKEELRIEAQRQLIMV